MMEKVSAMWAKTEFEVRGYVGWGEGVRLFSQTRPATHTGFSFATSLTRWKKL